MTENNDILKKIKGLFIVEDASTQSQNTTATQETTQTEQVNVPQQKTVSPSTVFNTEGAYNQKVFDSLTQALEANNMQGFDYLEFRGSLLSLSKMPMDEATRYRSAYAMAQTMGADVKKLNDTANHYLNVLKNEELKFQQALDNQRSNGLGAKEQEIAGLQNAINQKTELLKQIQQEIEQHQAQIENIKQQIGESSSKIAQAQGDFNITYDTLINQIQQDIQNIQKYL